MKSLYTLLCFNLLSQCMIETVKVNSILYVRVSQSLLNDRITYTGWFNNGNFCMVAKCKSTNAYIGSIFSLGRTENPIPVVLTADEARERYEVLKELYRSYAPLNPKG